MKVIIAHASAGAGHLKAAQALYNCLKEYRPQINTSIVDILEKSHPLFRFTYSRGYLFLVRHALFLWQLSFRVTAAKPLRKITRPIARFINRINTVGFAKLLVKEQPDYILSTHFLPSEISAELKKEEKIYSRLITIITDFGVHPYWISEPTDTYVVASDYTKSQLAYENIEEGRIKVSGIPVDTGFLRQYDRDSLCAKLKLEAKKFTVLISTGSFGIGPLREITVSMPEDVQVLVVCANNQRLKSKLQRLRRPNIRVFGFVNNMPELMALADLMITKPGGLSIAEILAKDLVPIFICPIPGQEVKNARVMEAYGIGSRPKRVAEIKDRVLYYKQNPDKLREIKNNILKIKKPFAAREICDALR